MKKVLLVLFCSIYILPTFAQFKANPYFRDVVHVENISSPENKRSLKKPIIHSLSIMTVNIIGLVVTDYADHDPSFSVFKDAYTKSPVWDDDPWTTNYVAHPLMGSETYLRAREAGFGKFGSFLFSTSMSLTWEFLIESWTERPSGQDLIITSTTGTILGECRYILKQKVHPKYYWIIDPINQLYVTIFKPKGYEQKQLGLGFVYTF